MSLQHTEASARQHRAVGHEGLDPRALAVAGALAISASAMFVKLSGENPATVAFFRCALALPILLPLMLRELRRHPRAMRLQAFDLLAGAFLGLDFLLWVESIDAIGAGIATVLVNVQVVIVPLLALAVTGERPTRRFLLAVPVLLGGVALAGGLGGGEAFGANPTAGVFYGAGAGAAYAVYLFLLRRGARPEHRVAPVGLATVGAAVVSLLVGGAWQGVHFAIEWHSLGWLAAVALAGQVVGWLFISRALPRLRSGTGAALLLLQPVGAVIFGVLILREELSLWQLAGCAIVVLSVAAVSIRPERADG